MNPADLTLASLESTPPPSSKTISNLALLSSKSSKLPTSAPRIDTEPIYTQLKSLIGDSWPDYKNALSSFLLGKLNQTELTLVLTPLLHPPLPTASSPSPLHLHNALLSALHFNASYRDPPPETTAPFVLATDTLTSSSSAPKPASGTSDAISDRLKREVMALSARDRRQIKSVSDAAGATGASLTSGARSSRRYREALDALPSAAVYGLAGPPSSTRSGGGGGGVVGPGTAMTNTDLEIRRRFALPLAADTREFPARENIRARMEPIAYEEGLVGVTHVAAAGELVETAVEMYVKELVSGWMGSLRADGEGLVQSRRYRKMMRGEERAEETGEVVRDVLGRLPVEIEYTERREGLGRADLRLAWRLEGGCRDDRFLGERWAEEEMEGVEMGIGNMGVKDSALASVVSLGGLTNGVVPNGNGTATRLGARADVEDGGDWGWMGGGTTERGQLMDVLNGALAVGS